MISLRELLQEARLPDSAGLREVAGLTADSRAVKPGFVFFAVPGTHVDGLRFAPAALAAGALAIVAEKAPAEPLAGATVVLVEDVRAALSHAAARFYPAQPATIVAVTGTSGKTSVASFTRQIWAQLGLPAAALGTTGLVTPDGETYGSLTTPDPVSLHQTLDQLAGQGVTHLAMEASSHGLDQRRLDGVRLAAGAFTNLSRDHLDYHPDLEAYLAAKMRMFEALLQPGQPAVIDADSEVADQVRATCLARGLKVSMVGFKGDHLRLLSAQARPASTLLRIAHQDEIHDVELPLAGAFMASNALVAAGLCMATGSPAGAVLAALGQLQGAPGRLEKVGERRGAPIFVDYAHKPDALEKVLGALRPLASGRLVVVFGCGGDRDAGKRPIMGEIAAKGADIVIVTDDNPRSEDPAVIRAAILAAAPGALEIADRGAAIAAAVDMLQAGDVLVVAGKGHETGQIVGKTVLPFSDHVAVRAALQDRV
jgi:UDP-N-acetylmuramoyl-L-alanyl-D-glutamate--2,6-diaminopimelate ligase